MDPKIQRFHSFLRGAIATGQSLKQAIITLKERGDLADDSVSDLAIALNILSREFSSSLQFAPDLGREIAQCEWPNAITTTDREVHVLMVLSAPRIVLLSNVLSDQECDFLVDIARDRLARSTVLNPTTGAHEVSALRSSVSTHFRHAENELVAAIDRRVSELLNVPSDHAEPMEVIRYRSGEQHGPHVDFFDPKNPGSTESLLEGGQRICTVVMYLNNVEDGGSTQFPVAGLEILPRKGSAVYFGYYTPRGLVDYRTLHTGSVVKRGEKWVATKIFRSQPRPRDSSTPLGNSRI